MFLDNNFRNDIIDVEGRGKYFGQVSTLVGSSVDPSILSFVFFDTITSSRMVAIIVRRNSRCFFSCWKFVESEICVGHRRLEVLRGLSSLHLTPQIGEKRQIGILRRFETRGHQSHLARASLGSLTDAS